MALMSMYVSIIVVTQEKSDVAEGLSMSRKKLVFVYVT